MFNKIKLNNGIPLLTEASSDVRSLCVGIWVKAGARYESPEKNGISHFLEHMFFKGTERRSAEDIAREIDSIGGELNAMTSTEYTLYYVKVLDEFMEKALDLLTDIFLNPTLPDDGIEKEKGIISEEINMVEDTPSDYVHELFGLNVWGSGGLGQPVLGTRDTIGAFTRADLTSHIEKYYGNANIVVACSGNFSESHIADYLNKNIGKLGRSGQPGSRQLSVFKNNVEVIHKDLSESHICLGVKGMHYSSDDRYAMYLLNTILGSGFSSRLFQNIREKRGHVYSIYSYHTSYSDTGVWSVYAGTEKKHVSEVINVTVDEITGLETSLTAEELARAKAQLKGNLILALESTSNKMTNIAKQELYYGRYYSPDDIIAMVDAVSLEELKGLAGRLVSENKFALTVYGSVTEAELKGSCSLF
ncbi:MAG: insulinase family protein [Nitrospiraceae bacterium]|nr:MAG: insulinase family protein [Nitrospiraceae bacterium]